MNTRNALKVLCWCFLIAVCIPGKSQQVENSIIRGLSLEDLFNIEITIASKTEETVADAPSSVTVFTRDEIINMGVTSLRELLNYVPGFQTTMVLTDGQYHAVQPRGRKTAGGGSTDVLFLIDGQRLNDSHSGGASNFSRLLTLGYVKQVEIIRGPGSALYGSNAFLGVVNIVTDSKLNEAYVRGGENGLWEAQANISKTMGDLDISLYLGTFSDDGQDYRFPEASGLPQTKDPREGGDAYLTLQYKRLTFRSRYQERNFDDFFNFDLPPNDVNFNKSWETSANATVNITDSEKLKINASVEYMRHRWRNLAEIIPKGVELFPGYVLPIAFQAGPYYWNVDSIAALDLDYQFSENQQFIAGIFYRNTDNEALKALSTYDPLTPTGTPQDGVIIIDSAVPAERDRQIWGAYLQDKITINDQLTMFLGARFDNYSDFGSTFNPRGGVIYSAPINAKFKLLYGSAFRAPSLTEIWNESPTRLPNPDLQPEEVQTLEFIYIQDFSTRGRLTMTVFHNDIDNIIVPRLGDNGSLQVVNEGQSKITGGEFEFSMALTDSILLKTTFTTIFDSKRSIPNQLPTSASKETFENFGSIILNYSGVSWTANISGIYRDKVEDLPDQAAYFLGNAKFQYRVSSIFSIDASVNNLFDEQYSTYGETFPFLNNGVPNRGRQASLGLKATF